VRPWRRVIRSSVIVLVIACVGLVVFAPQFAPKADQFCDDHQVGCSLATGFLSTGIVILTGYFVLFVWTLRRALRYYTELARTTPERLMPTPPRVRADAVRGREHLVRVVASESAFSRTGAPIVVVGDAGSGKTTFLLALAQHLARRDSVPVVISLRGATRPLSFRKLAEAELIRRIDPVVRADADAHRVWRQLCADGRIVVLADSLDDVGLGLPTHDRDHMIRAALADAKNDRIAVVATAQPETVPFAAPATQFELGPLDENEALDYLTARVSLRAGDDDSVLRAIVAAGQVTQSPLYLNIIAALYRAGETVPRPNGQAREALLVELLDAWVALVERRVLLPEVELEEVQRRRILDGLSEVAYVMTLASAAEMRTSALEEVVRADASSGFASEIDMSMLIEGASRLELIETFALQDDLGIRFNHTISQSYFTSRYLRRRPEASERLLDRAAIEGLDAVLMWSATTANGRAETAATLLDRAASLDADSALAFALTAHEVAAAAHRSRELTERAATATDAAWDRATPRGRLAAVRQLNGRAGEWSSRVLYRATRDPGYRVRWNASRAIVAGGGAAFAALEPDFSQTVDCACSKPWKEWNDVETHDTSVLAWIAPALAARVDGPAEATARGWVERLEALVPGRMPLGTEASLAQGFKLAALDRPTAWAVARAGELLERSTFWYARIVLLHALCLSCLRTVEGEKTATGAIRARLADDDEHPFVREAARLCLRAVRERDWTRYVWEDESALIGQSASALRGETAVLLGDLVLLLNLTEQGPTKEVIEERKDRTYVRGGLPYCLSKSRNRSEQIFGACDDRCDFTLCPYPPTAELVYARGEFSRAFCEHQIELAGRRPRFSSPGSLRRPAWWSRTTRASRRRFWEAMEARVL
jgi:hypothetical protein